MPAGRPATPIEVKRRRGNPGKRKLPAQGRTVALVAADGVPPVPVKLKASGRALWERVWDGPAKAWVSPELDLPAMEALCALVDQTVEMRATIAQDGITSREPIVTPAGHVVGEKIVAHPLIKELRAAEKQLQSWLAVLGFDPSARSRLGYAEIKRQSKLEELRERQQARR